LKLTNRAGKPLARLTPLANGRARSGVRLGGLAREAIVAAEEVWLSEASICETGLKWRRGKLGIAPRRLVDQALKDGFRMLAIGLEPMLLSGELRQAHADPLDRLLYAQARHHGYTLLTIDRQLRAFGARVHRP
jgi:PIN domain nuclease of toxin-antitoxin system